MRKNRLVLDSLKLWIAAGDAAESARVHAEDGGQDVESRLLWIQDRIEDLIRNEILEATGVDAFECFDDLESDQ